MPKKVSLKWNFLFNVLLTASAFLFPVVTSPYVSRILLPEGTGQIAFVTSMITYFSMFARLGIPTYGIRACAQVRDDKKELSRTAQEIFRINMAMTGLVYGVFFIALSTVPQFRQERALFLICSTTLLLELLGMDWLYKALEQYRDITLRSMVVNLFAILLTFLLVHKKEDYILYGGITVFATVGANLFNFLAARKLISFAPCKSYDYRRHLRPILVLFALSVATTIYTHLDVVMLRFYKSDQAVGYYDAAVKVKNLLVIFSTSLGTVLLPRISYHIKMGQDQEFKRLIKTSFHFVLLTALPLCVYFILMARESVLLLFGAAYEGTITPMQVLMPAVLFIGLTNVIGIQILVPFGKEKLVVYSTCGGALVDVVLNAFLIPGYGATGAAIGTLAAEAVVLIMQLFFLRSQQGCEKKLFLQPRQDLKLLLALLPATAILLAARMITFPGHFVALAMTATGFFIPYGALLLLLRYRI